MKSFNMFLSHLGLSSLSSMKKSSYEVALKGKKQIAEGTFEFVFEKPEAFSFKAGQHVLMTLLNSPETDSKGDSRFLTLANTPQDKDLIVAVRMTDSAFKRVLGEMKIGEKVLIQILLGVPHGAFALHDDSSKPAVFLVGGIGIVPAYSMIKDATQKKLSHKLFLFYSNRKPEDAPYLEELKRLEVQNPNFKLIATVTEPEKSWQGETGKINISMIKKYVKDLELPIYYISGLSDMVSAMETMLRKSGVEDDNIRAEEFTGFNLNEMQSMNGTREKSTIHAVRPMEKSHLLFIAIGLMVTVLIISHLLAATSIFSNSFTISFNNPVFYVMLGLMFIVIPFKFKHIKNLILKNIRRK